MIETLNPLHDLRFLYPVQHCQTLVKVISSALALSAMLLYVIDSPVERSVTVTGMVLRSPVATAWIEFSLGVTHSRLST